MFKRCLLTAHKVGEVLGTAWAQAITPARMLQIADAYTDPHWVIHAIRDQIPTEKPILLFKNAALELIHPLNPQVNLVFELSMNGQCAMLYQFRDHHNRHICYRLLEDRYEYDWSKGVGKKHFPIARTIWEEFLKIAPCKTPLPQDDYRVPITIITRPAQETSTIQKIFEKHGYNIEFYAAHQHYGFTTSTADMRGYLKTKQLFEAIWIRVEDGLEAETLQEIPSCPHPIPTIRIQAARWEEVLENLTQHGQIGE